MHDCLRVPALHTAPPIRSEPIKYALYTLPPAALPVCLPRQRESAVPPTLLVNRTRLVLDALGEELKELLRVLVLARGEEGGVFVRVVGGQGGDEVDRAKGGGVGFRGV